MRLREGSPRARVVFRPVSAPAKPPKSSHQPRFRGICWLAKVWLELACLAEPRFALRAMARHARIGEWLAWPKRQCREGWIIADRPTAGHAYPRSTLTKRVPRHKSHAPRIVPDVETG